MKQNYIINPYNPQMGAPPPSLAGRQDVLKQFEKSINQVSNGGTEKYLLLTGLRGVGKTVLLNRFEIKMKEAGWKGEMKEIGSKGGFIKVFIEDARSAILEMQSSVRAKETIKRALGALKSFSMTFPVGDTPVTISAEPLAGVADSSDLENDLRDVLVEVGKVAENACSVYCIVLDEAHLLQKDEFEALLMALHRTSQLNLPVYLVAAGLPLLSRLIGKAKSYSERGFLRLKVDSLDMEETKKALNHKALKWEDKAVRQVYKYTEGYSYFIQEYGRYVWDSLDVSYIDNLPVIVRLSDVSSSYVQVASRLNDNFFAQRFEKLPNSEIKYLKAMASLPGKEIKVQDINKLMGKTSRQNSTIRSRLIDAALIYSEVEGELSFTVPMCKDYILHNLREK